MTPQLLKAGVFTALVALLEPIQADFKASEEWQEIEKKAYPPAKTKKKEKRVKDKGSRHPGGVTRGVEAQPDGHVEGARKDEVSFSSGVEAAMENLDIKSNGVEVESLISK